MNALLSTAYWPNLHYFYYVLTAESICIERFENYQKQSFRNRTQILSSNGVLNLAIPIKKQAPKELIKTIEISYAENWQMNHWRAITSAYKNSPYFDFFEDEIKKFYFTKFHLLFDYNLEQMAVILKIIKQQQPITLSSQYLSNPNAYFDLREKIHPKIDFETDKNVTDVLSKNYYQTFGDKFGFCANLSVLDLLFNKGLGLTDYLIT